MCSQMFITTQVRSFSRSIRLPKRRGELLYGLAPCLSALQARRRKVYAIFTQDGFDNEKDKKRALKNLLTNQITSYDDKERGKVMTVSNDTISRLVGKKSHHQGIVMDVEPLTIKTCSPDKLLNFQRKRSNNKFPVVLLLYQVQDPMNTGAILRCAYYLGVDKVIVTSNHSCGLTPVVSKASSGAMELMPVHCVSNVPDLLKQAVLSDWSVTCACGDSINHLLPVISCTEAGLNQPTILVLGSEGYGLPSSVINCCTAAITIRPKSSLPPGFDSLNVSVAAGIILHSLLK